MRTAMAGPLIMLLCCGRCLAAEAGGTSEFYVNDSIAEGDFAAGNDINPGTSRDAPAFSIQALLDRYPTIGEGCTVHVSAGTFTENIVIDAQHGGLCLEGAGSGLTIIDGGRSGPCLTFDGAVGCVVAGFTFTNGTGGIVCRGASPTIAENAIVGNSAREGAGISADAASQPTIESNAISGNIAERMGGGIYCLGPCVIRNNVIVENRAAVGAGVHCTAPSGAPPAVIEQNTFAANDATGAGGGVMCVGSVTVAGNVITGNSAAAGGGLALKVRQADDIPTQVLVVNNILADNSATVGGGVSVEGFHSFFAAVACSFTNNTFSGNTADSAGGAIDSYDYVPSLAVTNCIVRSNQAPCGPAVALRAAYLGPDCTVSYSNIEGGSEAVYQQYGAVLRWGSGNLDVDPLFAAPDAGDYHLQSAYGRWNGAGWVLDAATSPCVDAGDPASGYAAEPQGNGARINMGAYGNTAEASRSSFYLAVGSTPINGVQIAGDAPGVTEYALTFDAQASVALTAPSTTIIDDGVRYDFQHWRVDGIDQPDDEPTVQIDVAGARSAVAVYALRRHTLAVRSMPVRSIYVWGSDAGLTDYTAACDDQRGIVLTAPLTVTVGGRSYRFVRWSLNGVDRPDGQNQLVFTITDDSAAEARYEIVKHELVVDARPVSSVTIAGTRPGSTRYSVTVDDGDTVFLQAPAAVLDGLELYDFVRWEVNGNPQPAGSRLVELLVKGGTTATAVYHVPVMRTLSVESAPISEVRIEGTRPGLTGYTVDCRESENVTLIAPVNVDRGGMFRFVQWLVDGAPASAGHSLQMTVAQDHAVQAVYEPVEGPVLILRGPGERGEGALPADDSEFTIDVYGENLPDFAGLQLSVEFLSAGNAADGFTIAYGGPPSPFSGYRIAWNEEFLPVVLGGCDGRIVVLCSVEQQIDPVTFEVLGYVDKTIVERTWLMSITYRSMGAVEEGPYAIAVGTETVVGNSDGLHIPCDVIGGSLVVCADQAPPAPDPMTWAVDPHPEGSTSISMIATIAEDYKAGVEYYFEEVSGNPGGSDSGWQRSPVYIDAGLTPGLEYSYRVKARDLSLAHNETAYSPVMSAGVASSGTDGPQTLEADTNNDCSVDILDLIFVRNRLLQDVDTADNRSADVNGDGKITVLDLIAVRNRLGTRCEE